jgi:transcriptional regulator with XRE-family HTH domain
MIMESGQTRRSSRGASALAHRYTVARRAFVSDAEMAESLGVHRSQIARWKQGTPPDPKNAERLLGLDVVVSLLEGFLEAESIPKWLRGTNAHLSHRRPLDVLREGRLSEVIRAIEAERSGAFA